MLLIQEYVWWGDGIGEWCKEEGKEWSGTKPWQDWHMWVYFLCKAQVIS